MKKELQDRLNKLNDAYDLLCDAFSKSKFADSFTDYDAFKLVLVIFLHDRLAEKSDMDDIVTMYDAIGMERPKDNNIINLYKKDKIHPERVSTTSDQFLDIIDQNLRNMQLQQSYYDTPSLWKEGLTDADFTDNASILVASTLNLSAYQNVLPSQTKKNIFDLFKSINYKNPDGFSFDHECVREVLDAFAESKKYMLAQNGITYIPWNVDDLMVRIANAALYEDKYLYSFGISNIMLLLADTAASQIQTYHDFPLLVMGHEDHNDLWALAVLRFAVFGRAIYKNFQPYLGTVVDMHGFADSADVIFYTPPLDSLKVINYSATASNKEDEGYISSKRVPELLDILSFLRNRMVALMPLSILSKNDMDSDNIRRMLINNDMLEAVIALPSGQQAPALPHQMALLVIKDVKPSNRANKVLFITATKDEENRNSISSQEVQNIAYKYKNYKISFNDGIVSREDIQQNSYILSMHLYTGSLISEINSCKSSNGRLLHDICKITVGFQISPKTRVKSLPIVNINNLSNNIKSPRIDFNKLGVEFTQTRIPHSSSINKLDECLEEGEMRVVKDKCILVSLSDTTLKPSIYNPDESEVEIYGLRSGVVLGHNVAAIIPDTSMVDFDYFYYQLHSDFVQRQHEAIFSSSRSGIPHIEEDGLNNIVIPIPKSLDEQRDFATDKKMILLKESNLIDARTRERVSNEKLTAELSPDEIKIAIQQGEYDKQEFKETLRYDIKQAKLDPNKMPRQAIMAIASFLNARGGDLFIGVSDNKSICGIDRDEYNDDKYLRFLNDKIADLLDNHAATCVCARIVEIEGKRICVISCRRSKKQVFMKSEKGSKEEFWVRMSAGKRQLVGQEMQDYIDIRFPDRKSLGRL